MSPPFPSAFATAVALLALAGCRLDAGFEGTEYRCPDGVCPSGFDCVNGVCSDPATDGGADPADAGPVADGDAGPDAGIGAHDAGRGDAGIDAGICELAAEDEVGDRCEGAVDLTAEAYAGGALRHGDTAELNHRGNWNSPLCGETGLAPGPDAFYRIDAEEGDTLSVRLVPDGWQAIVFIHEDCTQPDGDKCRALSNEQDEGAQEITYVAEETRTYYVVVGSESSGLSGCYELEVEAQPAAAAAPHRRFRRLDPAEADL